MDDLIGYIRTRQQVSADMINNRYAKILSTAEIEKILNDTTKLSNINSDIKYVENCISNDPIISKFLESVNQIRTLRHNLKSDTHVQINQSNIIDKNSSSINGIGNYLKRKNHLWKELLCSISRKSDEEGEYSIDNIASTLQTDVAKLKQGLYWFKHVGILNDDLMPTKYGKQVLEIVFSQELEKITLQATVVSISELQDNAIPPSIIINYLSKSDLYIPIKIHGISNKLFWTKKNEQHYFANGAAHKRFGYIRDIILKIMRSVNHSLTVKKISEEARKHDQSIGHFIVQIMINHLTSSKTGKLVEDGDSLKYPMQERISDFLHENLGRCFTYEEIIQKNHIASINRDDVLEALEVLHKNKRIARLHPSGSGKLGVWTYSKQGALDFEKHNPKVVEEYRARIQAYILEIIRKRHGGFDTDMLRQRTRGFAHDLCKNQMVDRNKLTLDSITELEQNGTIVIREEMYRISEREN